MDQQRPFLYLTLFFLGFLIWSTWQKEHAPKIAPPAGQETTETSSAMPTGGDSPATVSSNTTAVIPKVKNKQNEQAQLIHIKTDVLDLLIDTKGGSIIQADLPTYPVSLEEKDKATRIINSEKGYAAYSALIHQTVNGVKGAQLAPSYGAQFSSEKSEYLLKEGESELRVPLLWNNGNGLSVIKTFIFKSGDFLVKQEQQVNNQSSSAWIGRQNLLISHGEHKQKGGLMSGTIAYTGPAYYHDKYIKVKFGEIEDRQGKDQDAKDLDTVKGSWLAMLEHYFISAWIPPEQDENTYFTSFNKNKNIYYIGTKGPNKTINSGASDTFHSQFYVGPTDQEKLEKIAEGLDLTVDYGIFAFVSKPIFAVMKFIHKYVGNWGWTIILLTLLIKLIFFYPSAISYRSMAKMKKLGPKIKSIGEKFKNDPQAKQKATMEFYRKEKINPLGGCLPMLIQMPVFMGLYWVLQESVELRQAPWILWYKDLSLRDPIFILPLIYGSSMWIQQKLNPPAMQDPMQQKIFMYLPLVFTFMFLFFPAGLVLYWVVNNILSIAQQWFINKKIIGDT